MFGKKGNDEISKMTYEMESWDSKKKEEMIDLCCERISLLKTMLREENSTTDKYNEMGLLMHGYNSMREVINRIS